MKTLPPLNLEAFYDTVNDRLKGTFLESEQVEFKFWVRLPDEDRVVELRLKNVLLGRIDNEPRGTLAFHLETVKEDGNTTHKT